MSDFISLQAGGIAVEESIQARAKVQNEDGIILRGENAVLDASDTFISGRPSSTQKLGFNISWVCPIEMISICQGKIGNKLVITESQFKDSSGKYNTIYTFAARVEWTKISGVVEVVRALV